MLLKLSIFFVLISVAYGFHHASKNDGSNSFPMPVQGNLPSIRPTAVDANPFESVTGTLLPPLITRRRRQSGEGGQRCDLNACCSRLTSCEPKKCGIDERTCVALLDAGALAHFGRASLESQAFAAYQGQFGNLNLGAHPYEPFEAAKLKFGPGVFGTSYSKFGTLTIGIINGPTTTIVASAAPHLETDAYQLNEVLASTTIKHRLIVPEKRNKEDLIFNYLACGPVTVMELVGEAKPYRTAWTTITPTTTTTTPESCTKYATQPNMYGNVINFYTEPPTSGIGNFYSSNKQYGGSYSNNNGYQRQNQQPFGNRHQPFNVPFHRSPPPCYWCPAQYKNWHGSQPGFVPSTPTSLGWYGGGGGRPSFGSSFGRWFSDVAVGSNAVKDKKAACLALIEQYAETPLDSEKLVDFINKTFYGTEDLQKKYVKGVEPSTFHCCHTEFGKELFPKDKNVYEPPILPQNVTCSTLVNELYKHLSGSNEQIPKS